jgi:hypothetical protein
MAKAKLIGVVFFIEVMMTIGIDPSVINNSAMAEEGDFVGQISKVLPSDWSVDIYSAFGKCWVNITTAPIDTEASKYAQGNPGVERAKLSIQISIHPRYTPEMLDRIKDHNKPIREKLKEMAGTSYYSKEYTALNNTLIDEPMFYNVNYGFRIEYPVYVPKNAEDSQRIIKVMEKITSDWKSYEKTKSDVSAELRRLLVQ